MGTIIVARGLDSTKQERRRPDDDFTVKVHIGW
jgi:hypothetical protein